MPTNAVRLAPTVRVESHADPMALYQRLREANRMLGCDSFEGVVMKWADSVYQLQLRNAIEVFRGWQHCWQNHMGIITWILLGLVAGAPAKFIMPGKDPGGFFVAILIGIVSGVLGSFLRCSSISGKSNRSISAVF